MNIPNLFEENIQHHDEAGQNQLCLSVVQVVGVGHLRQFLGTHGRDGLCPWHGGLEVGGLGLGLQVGRLLRVGLDLLHAQLEDAQQQVHGDDDVQAGQDLQDR